MKRQARRNRGQGHVFRPGELLRRWREARRLARRRRDRDQLRRTTRPRRERFSDWDAISRYADPFE